MQNILIIVCIFGRSAFMDIKSLEEVQKSSNLWAESGYSYDASVEDTANNNTPNMISMYNEPIIVNINSSELLQKNSAEKNLLNKE